MDLGQVFRHIKQNKVLEYGLSGYEKLKQEDKQTIEYLINFFNKSR